MGNLASITYCSKKLGLTNLKIAAMTPYTFTLSMGVRKDWPELVSIIDRILDSIPEGEQNEIRDQWISMRFDHGMNWQMFWKWILTVIAISGAILGVFLYSNTKLKKEVKERRNAEEELRKLSKAVEQSPVSVIITDTEGNIEYVNPKFTQVSGYTLEEALGQNPRILKSGTTDSEVYRDLWETISSGDAWHGELQNRKKDGQLIWEAANISPIKSSGGIITHYIGLKENITQRKEMEASLIKSHEELSHAMAVSRSERKKAEAADRAKSEFLANMSHEIRTPMNAIIGMTHLVMQTDLDEKQLDYTAKIDMSARSLLGLINDILDFSKIEAGKMDMENLEFDLSESLDNLANLITMKAHDKKELEVLFRVDPETPDCLTGDPLRLNQVLVNLGNNAVKFTDRGQIIVDVQLIERTGESATIRFSVKDSGIGMTREQQGKLFRAFSQGDTSTTRKYGGTGLGLIISKRIVDMMGGSISLASEPGVGSEFSFTVTFGTCSGRQRPALPLDDDLAGLKTLIIDDNPHALRILTEMTGAIKLEADGAGSGQEGLAMVREASRPYELILMDRNMPEHEVTLSALRGSGGTAPKILLISTRDDGFSSQEEDDKADGFLTKPVSHSELLNAVMGAFGKLEAREKLIKRRRGGNSHLTRQIQGARILLVEDHEINQQVAQEILEAAGFFVEIAHNGQQGLEMAVEKEYDLVLMDLQMPVMDGYEATRLIRKKNTDLPIIAMTASAMPKDRERAIRYGMNAHVSKPIDLEELFGALAAWIPPGSRPLPDSFTEKQKDTGKDADCSLEDMPGINVKAALPRLDNNRKLYTDLLQKFRRDYSDATELLKKDYDSRDYESARRLAHSIKGVSGNIGVSDLQQTAAELEKAIPEKDDGLVYSLMNEFEARLATALNSMEMLCPGDSGGDDAPKKEGDDLLEMLQKLQPYIVEREAKPAKSLVREIAALSWPEPLQERVTDLSKSIMGYKFKDAQETADKLIKQLE